MTGLIIYGFVVFVLAVVAIYFASSSFKAKKEVDLMRSVPAPEFLDSANRRYYALRDEVAGEMLFSPFYAKNNACAIRQVQEVVKNPQLFPKSLHAKDVALYYVFTMNEKSLNIVDLEGSDLGNRIKLTACDEDSLKLAYEKFKEVK